jgi:hypothetical protein
MGFNNFSLVGDVHHLFINNPALRFHNLMIGYGLSLLAGFWLFFGGTMDKTLIKYLQF